MNEPHAYLFVDGSCGAKDDIGGWAAIAVSRTGPRKLLFGMACPTTISRCELMPIIEGVQWIHKNWAHRVTGFRLQVYSDSDYTVKTLNGIYTINRNKDIWAGALEFMTLPIHFTFTWVHRNTLPYMELCDGIAGAVRKQNLEMVPKLFNGFDHRNAIQAVPVEQLPTEENTTTLAKELACIPNALKPGAFCTQQTFNLDTSSTGFKTD